MKDIIIDNEYNNTHYIQYNDTEIIIKELNEIINYQFGLLMIVLNYIIILQIIPDFPSYLVYLMKQCCMFLLYLPNLDELTDKEIQDCQRTQKECEKYKGEWIINVINCPDQILLGEQINSEIKNNTWNLPENQECQIRNKCKIPDKSNLRSIDMFDCEQNKTNCKEKCNGTWNLPNK